MKLTLSSFVLAAALGMQACIVHAGEDEDSARKYGVDVICVLTAKGLHYVGQLVFNAFPPSFVGIKPDQVP